MNLTVLRVLLVLVMLVLGGYIGLQNIDYSFYIFGMSCVLLAVLFAKVNIRNKNYLGAVFTTKKGLFYSLTPVELTASVCILAFMASPFIGILVAAQYAN